MCGPNVSYCSLLKNRKVLISNIQECTHGKAVKEQPHGVGAPVGLGVVGGLVGGGVGNLVGYDDDDVKRIIS